jgi:hypothetical protein
MIVFVARLTTKITRSAEKRRNLNSYRAASTFVRNKNCKFFYVTTLVMY